MDEFTETTTQGWGSRLMASIKGVLLGLLLFIVSFPLLWWNEGRAVQTARSLEEGAGAVVSVEADPVEPANEGKLVHVSGKAATEEELSDPVFGVSANAISLSRSVEMFQWVEHVEKKKERKVGGKEVTKKTYKYSTEWDDDLVDSSVFKIADGHENPSSMKYSGDKWRASKVTLGAFTLSDNLVGQISSRQEIEVTDAMLAGARAEASAARAVVEKPAPEPKAKKKRKGRGKRKRRAKAKKKAKAITAAPAATPRGMPGLKVHGGSFYLGRNPSDPAIGDLRISFSKVVPSDVSVIAAQAGESFGPYQTQAGDALEMLDMGLVPAAAMFEAAQAANAMMTWILRLVGFALMLFGIMMVFRPLAVVADVVPLLGDILRMGSFVVGLALALPLTLLTIAIAWLFFRPLLGVLLLATGIAAVVGIKVLAMKKKAAAAPAQQPAAV